METAGISTWTITVTKGAGVDDVWVDGQVCVQNGGIAATLGLSITDDLYYQDPSVPGGFVALSLGNSVPLGTNTAIAVGATVCYDYSVDFTSWFNWYQPASNVQYKNIVHVSISNAPPPPGTSHTYSTDNTIWGIPASPTLINNAIDVTDTNGRSYHFSASGSASYDQTFTCPDSGTYTNTATITQIPTQTSTARVTVTCLAAGGCAYSHGLWMTHDGSGPQDDLVTQYLPISLGSLSVTTNTQAHSILSDRGSDGIKDSSNGINKLYRELLAAQLNIANGADATAVASTISAANSFLLSHDSTSWSGLSDTDVDNVSTWFNILNSYNEGTTGPGFCPNPSIHVFPSSYFFFHMSPANATQTLLTELANSFYVASFGPGCVDFEIAVLQYCSSNLKFKIWRATPPLSTFLAEDDEKWNVQQTLQRPLLHNLVALGFSGEESEVRLRS